MNLRLSDHAEESALRPHSVLEINADAFVQNAAILRREIGTASLGVVVKANAYGHGLAETLSVVHPLVDWIYVTTPSDALTIRSYERRESVPPRRILVMGVVRPGELADLAANDVDVVIGDASFAAWGEVLKKRNAPPLKVHVHVDTGLGREGFLVDELTSVIESVDVTDGALVLEGLMSHFANVEDVTKQEYALRQVDTFARALTLATSAVSGRKLVCHMAASAASLVLPSSRMDVVRVGISFYGLWASGETRVSTRVVSGETPTLRPVMSWRVRSQIVRTLPAGSFVGYGCTYRCAQETKIAVLPVGYSDGYPRLLSGRAHVLVDGKRCPVLGRVMMNHIVIDVSHILNDLPKEIRATLLGDDGKESVTAEMLASWADTISYEIVARMPPHLHRTVTSGSARS